MLTVTLPLVVRANPALYRLMFGPALAEGLRTACNYANGRGGGQGGFEGIILRGARSGLFALAPEDQAELGMATLSCWSAVHGLAMLIVDAKAEAVLPLCDLVDGLIRFFLNGLHRR